MQTDLLAAYRPFDEQPKCTAKLGEPCSRDGTLCCDCALACSANLPRVASSRAEADSFWWWLGGDKPKELDGAKKGEDANIGKCVASQLSELRVWENGWDGPKSFTLDAPFESSPPPVAAHKKDADGSPDGSPGNGGKAGDAPPPPPPPPPQPPWLRIATPNSNANVDLNGDCRADLVVVSVPPNAPADATCDTVACTLLLWLQQAPPAPPVSTASAADGSAADMPPPDAPPQPPPPPPPPRWLPMPSLNLTLPVGASQLAFSDLDADGLIDLVFAAPPQEHGGNASVHIWYAQLNTPSGFGVNQSWCVPPPRAVQPLCIPPVFSTLSFFQRAFYLPSGWKLGDGGQAEALAAGLPARPPTLSVADFFLDGFPDVLLPLHAPDDWQGGYEHGGCAAGHRCLVLLHNDDGLRCEREDALHVFNAAAPNALGSRAGGRGGGGAIRGGSARAADPEPSPTPPRIFPLLPGVSSAAFFDLFEDGVWDVLAAYPNGSISAWRQPQGGLDNYFLKVVATDGACAPAPLDGKLVLPNVPSLFGEAPPPPPREHGSHGAADKDDDDDEEEARAKAAGRGRLEGRRAEVAGGASVATSALGGAWLMAGRGEDGLRAAGNRSHGGSSSGGGSSSDGAAATHEGGEDGEQASEEQASKGSSSSRGGGSRAEVERGGGGSTNSRCIERKVGTQGYMAGVNQPGVAYQFLTSLPTRWELVDAADAFKWNRPKQARAGTQLPQSAYSPLITPYVLVGLGQTNDYVQDLMVGLPSGQIRGFSQAIIPNSRLVVIPFPYNQTDKWELRLYLEARQQLYVGLTLLGLLLVLGVVILILELRERVQDAREKKALAPALPL